MRSDASRKAATEFPLIGVKRRLSRVLALWMMALLTVGAVTALPLIDIPLLITDGLVLHLSFDGNFSDDSGRGNHATAMGSPALVPGFVGSGAVNVYSTDQANNYLTLGVRPDLSFGTATDFTIAFWAKVPNGSWTGDPDLSNPSFIGNRDNRNSKAAGWVLTTGNDGRLQWTYCDKKSTHYDGPAGTFGTGFWHHIALVVERGSADRTYVDGILVNSQARPDADGTLDSGLPVNIGNDGTGQYPMHLGAWINPDGQVGSGTCLDDLGIWRRALSTQEIGAIYNAGLLGKNLTQASLLDLDLGLPARITVQPVSVSTVAGSSVSFSVTATGTLPLLYQWRKDGLPILGANASALTLANVDIDNDGDYSVLVSNLAGAETSVAAKLTVTRSLREAWNRSYDGPAASDDTFVALKTDAQGNVYLTGASPGEGTGRDIVTVKYGPGGDRLWVARYDGPASKDDSAVALALDNDGNVIVTGSSPGADDAQDIVTIKYDANGNQLWLARYEAESRKPATAAGLAVDAAGNVYVTGAAQAGSHFGYATLKYDSGGALLWASRYVGPADEEDRANAITVDADGNTYVTGKSKGVKKKFDFATVKYGASGQQIWVARYNGPSNDEDEAVQLALDALGNVYVTGKSKGNGTDFDLATVAYSNNGSQVWVARYNAPTNKGELAAGIAVDSERNVIVGGASRETGGDLDFVLLKYTSSGALLWKAVYDGAAKGDDQLSALAVDAENDIYATGWSKGGAGRDFATVKFSAGGEQLWAARYNGPANGDDVPHALTLGGQGKVLVCGDSRRSGTGLDGFIVQYEQPQAPIITTQPLGQSCAAGGAVTFTAAAVGTGPLSWQWRLNGVNLPGATSPTLTLENVQALQSGVYQVVVRNAAASVVSAPALLLVTVPVLALNDLFNGSLLNSALSGVGQASNIGASREAGEPRIAGKIGGKSLWFSWRAPASGIVTFTTTGSDFDTLLGVFTGSSLAELVPVAGDDDSGGFLTSKVAFNATVGTEYHICVDGLNGVAGNILLSWVMEVTTERLPVITSLSLGETVGVGGSVTYSAEVDQPGATYQWYHNGDPIPGATLSSIELTGVQPAEVGLYYVRVEMGGREVLSKPIQLQINDSDGAVQEDLAALDKLADALDHAARGVGQQGRVRRGLAGKAGAPSRGYSGTQIFSTYGASTESGEPGNCGVTGGASAWFAYQAPVSGTMYVNTDGSDFDTTLGVYTGDGSSFESLVSLGCDDNSGANGRTSALRVPVTGGTTYYIAVDGVNGASGQVVLNYSVGDPPVIEVQPQSQVVQPGGNTTLSVSVNGTSPYACEWRLNGNPIAGATQASFAIQNAQPGASGTYSVLVSNLVGVTYSTEALLTVADTLAPLASSVSATQVRAGTGEVVDVRNGAHPAVPGVVSVSIAAADPSGLAENPQVVLNSEFAVQPASFVSENPAGQFNYTATLPSDTVGTTWTVTASTTDNAGNNGSTGVMTLTVPPPLNVSGHVLTYGSGRPLKDVNLQVSGSIQASALSGTDGGYSMLVNAGGNYTLAPAKSSDASPSTGISTLDIALVRRHVLGLASLDSPYKLLAADVNGSRSVSTLDISLMRRVILGMASSFPPGLWRFVPSDYAFADSRNPWSAPGSQSFNNVLATMTGRDFIAVKLGDVNNSWVSLSAQGPSTGGAKLTLPDSGSAAAPSVEFAVSSQEANPGGRAYAKISVKRFQQVTTAQCSFAWDPTVLRYVGVGEFGVRGLAEENFGADQAHEGKLALSWDDPQGIGVTLPDGASLVTVTFEVIGSEGGSSAVRFTDNPTPREASVEFAVASFVSRDGEVLVGAPPLAVSYAMDAGHGVVHLSLPTRAGVAYLLEFTDCLCDSPWIPLSRFTGDGEVRRVTDLSTSAARYYRLRVDSAGINDGQR